MKAYKSKYKKLPGTSFDELMKAARKEYHLVQKRNPRRHAYVRSAYFRKDKVFINSFWEHLKSKHSADQQRRLQFYVCALDLLRNCRDEPDLLVGYDNLNILRHRFIGQTKDGELFAVQVKQSKRTGRKDFISVFPISINQSKK